MSTYEKNQVFTTGQISKICQVAPRTVSKWFDTGRLRGYRIPGSNDRRVPRENLVVFMREHGIPLGPLAQHEASKVLLVGISISVVNDLQMELPSIDFEIQAVATAFEAGVQANAWQPDCVLIETSIGRDAAEGIAQGLRRARPERPPLLIALLSREEAGGTVDAALFDDRFRTPFDVALLAARIRHSAEHSRQKV
ncbi:MAG: hypothetical protein ACK5Q5_05605 [Planctomycetaceae bacterium]